MDIDIINMEDDSSKDSRLRLPSNDMHSMESRLRVHSSDLHLDTRMRAPSSDLLLESRLRASSCENHLDSRLRLPSNDIPYYESDFSKNLDPPYIPDFPTDFGGQPIWHLNDADYSTSSIPGFDEGTGQLTSSFSISNPSQNYADFVEFQPSSNASSPRNRHPLVATGSAVTPQTRHARRIYVGNIPSGFLDEDNLRTFLNGVICKGLGDENDSTYILSIYVNQQKCFAFVELNSIELTTAALELDGILYRNSPLKILRANEYKPELLPPPSFPPIKLNLSGLMFGNTSSNAQTQMGTSSTAPNLDPQVDHIVKYCSVNTVQKGSIVIVGFPYEDQGRRSNGVTSSSTSASSAQNGKNTRGCALAPRVVRTALRKFQSGSVFNPEYGVDISQVKIVDVGDVQGGMTLQEAYSSLSDIVTEIIHRGGIPLVIGGPSDLSSSSAQGLMSITSNPIAFVGVGPSLDTKLLDDSRFFMQRGGLNPKMTCEGRYIQFAAQGSSATMESARTIQERGGRIYWLSRDLRGTNPFYPGPLDVSNNNNSNTLSSHNEDVGTVFRRALQSASNDYVTSQGGNTTGMNAMNAMSTISNMTSGDGSGSPLSLGSPPSTSTGNNALSPNSGMVRPTCVAVDLSSLSSSHFPGQNQCRSIGLTSDEALSICVSAGLEPNVVMLTLTEFNPEVEENRSSRLVVDMIYHFVMGVAYRTSSSFSVAAVMKPPPISTSTSPSSSGKSPLFRMNSNNNSNNNNNNNNSGSSVSVKSSPPPSNNNINNNTNTLGGVAGGMGSMLSPPGSGISINSKAFVPSGGPGSGTTGNNPNNNGSGNNNNINPNNSNSAPYWGPMTRVNNNNNNTNNNNGNSAMSSSSSVGGGSTSTTTSGNNIPTPPGGDSPIFANVSNSRLYTNYQSSGSGKQNNGNSNGNGNNNMKKVVSPKFGFGHRNGSNNNGGYMDGDGSGYQTLDDTLMNSNGNNSSNNNMMRYDYEGQTSPSSVGSGNNNNINNINNSNNYNNMINSSMIMNSNGVVHGLDGSYASIINSGNGGGGLPSHALMNNNNNNMIYNSSNNINNNYIHSNNNRSQTSSFSSLSSDGGQIGENGGLHS